MTSTIIYIYNNSSRTIFSVTICKTHQFTIKHTFPRKVQSQMTSINFNLNTKQLKSVEIEIKLENTKH
jgi:hypothetical protein